MVSLANTCLRYGYRWGSFCDTMMTSLATTASATVAVSEPWLQRKARAPRRRVPAPKVRPPEPATADKCPHSLCSPALSGNKVNTVTERGEYLALWPGGLPGRLDRQLACRAERDGVGAVFPEPGRDRLAVQGPNPAPPRLLGIVGQLP